MKSKEFVEYCIPGAIVFRSGQLGTVIKTSKDKSKALVEFRDGTREWCDYYMLEAGCKDQKY